MPTNKKRNRTRVEAVVETYRQNGEETDPLGMYTGVPSEAKMAIDPADPAGKRFRALRPQEKKAVEPIQDADDL